MGFFRSWDLKDFKRSESILARIVESGGPSA
jgi:hypothetical protein